MNLTPFIDPPPLARSPSQIKALIIGRITKLQRKSLVVEQIQVVMGWEEEDPLNPIFDQQERLRRIQICKGIGLTQTQTILAIWGQSKGGGQRYKKARELYQQLEAQSSPGDFPEDDTLPEL